VALGRPVRLAPPHQNAFDRLRRRRENRPPLRFIGVYHPHGIAAELFARREGETETSFALDYPDSPLQPFDDAATYGRSFKDNIVRAGLNYRF